MARFPDREAEIKALAQSIITGLTGNPDFPNPPVSPAELQTQLDSFITLGDQQVADQAAAQQSTEAKQAGRDVLTGSMKSVLRAADSNSAKLAALGWSGKAAPTPLQQPGQPRSLEALRHGEGWLFLDWKEPAEGGKAAFYRLERRKLPGGSWELAGMAVESEATLVNQERGKEWDYRVVAVNKAGESGPSNSVTAVL